MKKFKAIYTKTFEAEHEDALRIALLNQPAGTELENVEEVEESNLHPLFEQIFEDCNPTTLNKILEDCKIKTNK
jgi:hypothetical protein